MFNFILTVLIVVLAYYTLKFLNCEIDELAHLPYYGILANNCKSETDKTGESDENIVTNN